MQSRELDFLCCTIGPRANLERAKSLLALGINWQALSNLAGAHGVRPQLLRALHASFWDDISRETKQELEIFQRYHLARSLHVAKELAIITDAFAQNGIRYAILKGITLAVSLYGNISGREFVDIDVIVDEDNVAAAGRILEASGYAAKYGNAEFRAAFLSYQRQYMFVDQESKLAIELHWDFVWTGDCFPLQTSEIWQTLERISVADREIPTLGPDELAIFLAGHGTKEGWSSLRWMTDFAEFLVQNPGLDWIALYHRAQGNRCGRSILLGGLLVSTLLDVNVCADLMTLINRDPHVQASAKKIVRRLCQDASVSEQQYPWSYLCERWPQRLRACWARLSTRSTGDYEAMPLPLPLWRLYHVTRPFRLCIKALRMAPK
jgi:hypothetical protein